MHQNSHLTYRPDIDGLRAIAIISVLGFHAYPKLIPGGFAGVDIFFVISGFLISGIILKNLKQGSFSYIDFYKKRINRIFPALSIVLLTVWVAGWFSLFRNEFIFLGKHIFGGSAFLSNILFLKESGYFDTTTELKPLLHLWSLGVEEQFYIFWPLFFLLFSARRSILMPGILLVMLLSFALNIWATFHKPDAAFYLPITRFWELLIGGFLAYATVYKKNSSVNIATQPRPPLTTSALDGASLDNAKAIGGLLLLAASMSCLDKTKAFPGWWALLPTAGTYLLISAGPLAWVNRNILSSRPFIFIGQISYPLYLWHWPLLSYSKIISGGPPSTKLTDSVVILAFPLAWLTYRFIETPVRLHKSSGKLAALLLTLVASIGTLGLTTYFNIDTSRLDSASINRIDRAIGDRDFPAESVAFNGDFILNKIAGSTKRSVLFIGDSHTEQYWSRVKKVLGDNHVNTRTAIFATYAGCPPLPDVNRIQPGFSCDRFFDFAINAAKNNDVDTVVFSGFWEAYFGLAYESEDSRPLLYNVTDKSATPIALGSIATDNIFREFGDVIESLRHQGKSVYIILSNPASPDFNPVSMLPDRLHPMTLPIPKNLSRTEFVRHIQPVISKLESIAFHTGSIIIDPVKYLCEDSICRTTSRDGSPVYKDTNHMRPSYVREKAGFIDQVLLNGH